MVKSFLVFISSTSELQDERRAIEDVLPGRCVPFRHEKETARGISPRRWLDAVLARTDVFVGILGARYGSIHPADEKGRSIVEWEVDTAIENRERMEIFVFPKSYGGEEVIEERQRALIHRLGNFEYGLWLKPFESLTQLKIEFLRALTDWLSLYKEREYELEENAARIEGRRRRFIRWSLACGLLAGLVLAGAALVTNQLSAQSVAMICALFAVGTAAAMLLTNR